jgi:hypothetical protein
MRFLPLLFLLNFSFPASATAPVCLHACAAPLPRCLPEQDFDREPDGWLLLAGLVVCAAGRMAVSPRG